MSTVLWVTSLIGEKASSDGDDKPLLMKYTKALSSLSAPGAKKFSEFIDDTEARANLLEDFQGFSDGWELIKHRATWHSPNDGITVITHILSELERQKPKAVSSSDLEELKRELSVAKTALQELETKGGKFNLGVVT